MTAELVMSLLGAVIVAGMIGFGAVIVPMAVRVGKIDAQVERVTVLVDKLANGCDC